MNNDTLTGLREAVAKLNEMEQAMDLLNEAHDQEVDSLQHDLDIANTVVDYLMERSARCLRTGT